MKSLSTLWPAALVVGSWWSSIVSSGPMLCNSKWAVPVSFANWKPSHYHSGQYTLLYWIHKSLDLLISSMVHLENITGWVYEIFLIKSNILVFSLFGVIFIGEIGLKCYLSRKFCNIRDWKVVTCQIGMCIGGVHIWIYENFDQVIKTITHAMQTADLSFHFSYQQVLSCLP